MARGRKRTRVRVSDQELSDARKKVKSVPKRGRWPKFDNIYDKDAFAHLVENPSDIILHPEAGNVCFEKFVKLFNEEEEKLILSSVNFYCDSYNGSARSINDNVCRASWGVYSEKYQKDPVSIRAACPRISCPYHKKGFIATALKEKIFKKDVDQYIKSKSDAEKAKEEKNGKV